MNKIYILNTPVLTSYGKYIFRKFSIEKTRKLLLSSNFVSAVGHEATAKFLSQLLGIEIAFNRVQIKMQKGDRAIVFKLLDRLPEGKVLSLEELKNVRFEIGLLIKI
ncbi:MAG: YddF family protein [Thermoplasmata archaeon]